MRAPSATGTGRDFVNPESSSNRVNKTTRATRECGLVRGYNKHSSDYIFPSQTLDDAGCNAVSFICNNGTDLDAGADMVWVDDNVWTSFVSCPGVKRVFP